MYAETRSGTAPATLTPTGRSWGNLNEYTALGRLSASQIVALTPGHYWMTAVPQCTVQSIRSGCSAASYYLSDVEDVPPPHAKGFESLDESYWDTPQFGYNFAETGGPSGVCSQPFGGGGCDKFSAGLLGTATLDN
jgi:hypothetical protein